VICEIVSKVPAQDADTDHMDPSLIVIQALHQADIQLESVTANFASMGAASPNGTNLDVVDLSAEMVVFMLGRSLFEANLSALETAGEMQKSVINIVA
jgi:hypothetical protein